MKGGFGEDIDCYMRVSRRVFLILFLFIKYLPFLTNFTKS